MIKEKQNTLRSIGMDNIISIDESAFYIEMTSLRGWCKRGKELKTIKTKMRFKKYTLTLAITTKGVVGFDIRLGSMNSKAFIDFLEKEVLPYSHNADYLLMDNVSFHKTNEFKEFIKHNNKRVVYTVPYSPDLNPIENVFSSLKHYVSPRYLLRMIFSSTY